MLFNERRYAIKSFIFAIENEHKNAADSERQRRSDSRARNSESRTGYRKTEEPFNPSCRIDKEEVKRDVCHIHNKIYKHRRFHIAHSAKRTRKDYKRGSKEIRRRDQSKINRRIVPNRLIRSEPSRDKR